MKSYASLCPTTAILKLITIELISLMGWCWLEVAGTEKPANIRLTELDYNKNLVGVKVRIRKLFTMPR